MTESYLRTKLDPYITSADKKVDTNEMLERHTPPSEMSGEGMTVVVQDSGLDQSHPRIKKNVNSVEFHDFTGSGEGDAVGHGTMVTDLTTRYATGPDVIVNRVFGKSGSGGFEPFRKSFEWILDNADRIDAVVMSWGTKRRVSRIDNYVNEIARAGVVPFAAAGNSGGSTGSPATAKHCVSVGALQEKGERMTNFSSWDQDNQADPGLQGVPDVTAIGKNVVGARADGTSMGRVIDEDNVVSSGTSFSNPFVADLGLDLMRREGLTAKQVVSRLEGTAVQIPGTARDGLGRVNWKQAVAGGGNGDNPQEPAPTAEATVWSLPWSDEDWIQLDSDTFDDGQYTVNLDKIREAFSRR